MMKEKECRQRGYMHNNRIAYNNGFFCKDCKTFFPQDSETYKRYSYLHTLGFVVNNIGVDYYRKGLEIPAKVQELKNALFLDQEDIEKLSVDELNELINNALDYIHSEGKTDKSAVIIMNRGEDKD